MDSGPNCDFKNMKNQKFFHLTSAILKHHLLALTHNLGVKCAGTEWDLFSSIKSVSEDHCAFLDAICFLQDWQIKLPLYTMLKWLLRTYVMYLWYPPNPMPMPIFLLAFIFSLDPPTNAWIWGHFMGYRDIFKQSKRSPYIIMSQRHP